MTPAGSLTSNAAAVLLLKHLCPPLKEHKVLLTVASAATASTQWSLDPISAKLQICQHSTFAIQILKPKILAPVHFLWPVQ